VNGRASRKTGNVDHGASKYWCLYVLECGDGTFYTGITNDLARRLERHNAGEASRYTRSRLPVMLIYHERCRSKSGALKKECRVKSLSRKEKEAYIRKKSNPP
jgi:predicted GIY-YIG superfamily endonuclease